MFHIFIKVKGDKEWIDVGPVSELYEDTDEGIIAELDRRFQDMAKAALEHYGPEISGVDMKYCIGEQPMDDEDSGVTFH